MLTFNLKKEWFDKIKSGEKTHEEISSDIDMSVGNIKAHTVALNDFIEVQGYVFKNKRYKFPELVEYLQSLPKKEPAKQNFLIDDETKGKEINSIAQNNSDLRRTKTKGKNKMFDEELKIEYPQHAAKVIEGIKKGYTELADLEKQTGKGRQQISVIFGNCKRLKEQTNEK